MKKLAVMVLVAGVAAIALLSKAEEKQLAKEPEKSVQAVTESEEAAPQARSLKRRHSFVESRKAETVDEDETPCTDDGFCGLARACVAGRCTGCASDEQCAASETCVLDRCVVSERVECRADEECTADLARCVLSGVTPLDPRGNRDMRAYCLVPNGESTEKPELLAEPNEPIEGRPVTAGDQLAQRLLEELE